MKNNLLIFGLTSFFFLALVGVASAAIGTEAGDWEYKFDSPETKASQAARDYDYNQESLAVIGSEAGNWEYQFDAPETKADVAARNHVYDHETLAVIGTEAGNWEFNTELENKNASQAVADESGKPDAVCSEC